jgi:predicted transcriptional regulator
MEKTAKEQMLALIQDLPDDTAFDEILRELAFYRMLERGLADAEAGRVISADEMRKRVRSWRRTPGRKTTDGPS